jgi:hypothetical protein
MACISDRHVGRRLVYSGLINKTIALAFLQVQWLVYHPGFEKTVCGKHCGNAKSRFAFCLTDTGRIRERSGYERGEDEAYL